MYWLYNSIPIIMLKTELFCIGIGTKIIENVPKLSSTMTLLLSWPDNVNTVVERDTVSFCKALC